MYTILAGPRFVTATPTWENYLLTAYAKPDIPDNSLLPKNKEETDNASNEQEVVVPASEIK